MPGDPGGPVVTTLVWFLSFPREATGAACTRHSPRPMLRGGCLVATTRALFAPRDRGGMPWPRVSEGPRQSVARYARPMTGSAKRSIYFAATRLIMRKTTTSLQGGLAIAGSAARRPRGPHAGL